MSAGRQGTAAVAIIPSRYGSSRIPAKALADIGGAPMVRRVYQRALQATSVERVIVATDDPRIREAVGAGANVVMTDPSHPSGSDRVAEVARTLDCSIVVNIQGDLPLLDPVLVDRLVAELRQDVDLGIATVAVPIRSEKEFLDPSVVKVVCGRNGRALYFSRAPIPLDRDRPRSFAGALHHIGLYAYRRETLLRFAALAPTPLERVEKLEQLRALENGITIGVIVHDGPPPLEVDTAADLEAARRALMGTD
jgi:3-deoxy-manno-octulosonate cytidylyltransferase (CMP-KDO synthetase)